jgi:fibro-slime domain-containing protein
MTIALMAQMHRSLSWSALAIAALGFFLFDVCGCAVDSSGDKLQGGGSGGAATADNASAANVTATGAGGGEFTTSSGVGGAGDECDNILEVTYRDFTELHPDFEMPFSGDVVRRQLMEPFLGADKRPVFLDAIGCPPDPNDPLGCANWKPTEPVITSAATFADWYHTVEGVNEGFDKTITLTEDPPGSETYVFDSASFFPLGPNEGLGVSPMGNNPNGKNFLFTTEIHLNFTYQEGQVFTFRGDDDLWIFVNNRIALDLGSMHGPEQGQIDFDAMAGALAISPGGVYAMDIFHAERHTSGSNFRFETNISCFVPVEVPQ